MAASVAMTFSWIDYFIFAITLFLSASIGVFWSIKSRRKLQESAHHHLTGDRKLQILPVTMSLSASFLSAVFIIGTPTEIYVNGGTFVFIIFCYPFVTLATSLFFIPTFHRLKLTSAYEYLERRFDKRIRILGSLTFTVEMIVYLGVVTYTPSLALSQVTGMSMDVCILAVGSVCTFYTAIGGIKAVVWTDVLQLLVIVCGLLALVIQGTLSVGGWSVVMEKATIGKRMPQFDFNPDPLANKNTFWTLNIGGFFTFMTVFSSNQATLQRYGSVKTHSAAQTVLWLSLPLGLMNLMLVCMLGIVISAKYFDCDPFISGRITKLDQIVPLFMMDTLGFVPGLPGLFISCIFSASLSTVSSGVNSLAAVAICDFISPVIENRGWKPSARFTSIMSIICSLLYGLVTIGIAYLAGAVGKTVLRIGMGTFGMLGGPLLGLFICGILLPYVNSYGAGIGMICSLMTSLWLGIGSSVNPVKRDILPLLVDGCSLDTVNNSTAVVYEIVSNITTTLKPSVHETTVLEKIYGMSYFHYSTVSVLVAVVVASLVSYCTGGNRKPLDPVLYVDIVGNCRRILASRGRSLWGYRNQHAKSTFIEETPHPYALVPMPKEENGHYIDANPDNEKNVSTKFG